MSWPDTREEGYKHVIGKVVSGGDLWESQRGINVASCKAVCNSNSKCKSVAFNKTDRICWLNTQTESATTSDNSTWDMYYKQGEPANEKKIFLRDGNTSPTNGWDGNGLFGEDGAHNCAASGEESVRVGEISYGGNSLTDNDDSIQCSWVPQAVNMCPNIGETTDDLVYFRHSVVSNDKVGDYDWGGRSGGGVYGDTGKFGNHGSQASRNTNQGIICGYNRIKKDKWADLVSRYGFTENEKNKVIKQHCEGPGVTSKELAADSTYCGAMMISKTEYNQAILNKLKAEPNWWNDATNCVNFQNVIVGNTSDQAVMRVAGELIDALPNTGWSDNLVKAINAIKVAVSGALDDKLDDKSKAYCDASTGDTNSKCGCRNAIKYGKLRQCRNEIQGCTDVKRSYDLIDKAKSIRADIGDKLETTYDPKDDSEACKQSINPSSTILNIGNTIIRNTNFAGCFNAIENSGTISGDVRTECDVAITIANQQQSSSSSESTSNNDDEDEDEDGTLISGETAGIKNDYWLIGLCLCCICFLIIGVGLAAVLI